MDTSAVAVVALGLSVFALAVVVAVAVRVGRLLRSYDAVVLGGAGAAGRTARQGRDAVPDAGQGLRRVAVVRFDAFADGGGQLSFSAALLDDSGDGLVLTSVNGRDQGRTWCKAVQGGASAQQLSPEELQAITEAMARPRTRPGAEPVSS